MAYSITYGCINSPGSSSDYITSGPYLAGAIRFTASRNTVNDPNVKVICDIYAGFGSYSNFGSYTSTPIYARPWYGSTSYSTASNKLNIAMNSGTWSRTSNTSQRLSTLGGLTATGYPTITSSTNQVLCSSINWTSGTKTFFIYFAGADGYQAKSVSVACPAYHADVTISYNANGGTGAPSSQTKIYGTNLTLRSGSPSRTGYTFKGWASSSTATTAEWQPSGILSAEGARTLYAIWEAKTYTITYNSNNGSGAMANSTATYNQNFITRENAFIKTGYTFNGWKSKSNPSDTQYTSEDWGLNAPGVYESGKSQKWSIAEDRYLYAQWTVNSYTLIANAGEGTIPTTSGWIINNNIATKIIQYNDTFGTLPTPTRAGYVFAGWFTASQDEGGSKVDSSTHIGATDINIYAHWNVARYTVYYDINGGSGTISPSTVTFAPTESIKLNSTNGLTRTNYTASGWNTVNDVNQPTSTHFDSNTYFNSSSTTFDDDNSVTLYVQWQGTSYTVTYNLNGGEGTTPSAQTANYGTQITLSSTRPTRTNYYFKGWNTKQDGNGDTYQPGETYNKYLTVTLYAQWESNDFSITFDSNYLQDYNAVRNQVAFGVEAADNAFNSHSGSSSQGLYTTGIYVKSSILDNYGTGVLSGQLIATNLERALLKASYSSGIMGSINLTTAYTNSTPNIPIGWYNYIYVPHRNGGGNGAAQSDNCNYGSMLLFGMNNSNGIFRIKRDSNEIEKFYTTLNKPTASDVNAIPVSDKYTRSSAGHLDWPDNQSSVITKAALAFWNGRYSASDSNLQYSKNGEINRILTYSDSRETSADLAATGKRGITAILSSSAMTTSRPTGYTGNGAEGTIIHCEWDNNGGWNSQLFIGDNDTANGKPFVAVRGQKSGTWTAWDKLAGSWIQIGSGSNTTSKITFSSATTNYNEIMVVASTLRNGSYHLFSGVLPSAIIDTTSREFKLSGGTGITTATNCGAWGGITTTGFTPVGVWINNTAFNSNTTWYIYGR